ncbi:hypothetical protein PG993_008475 [Apiospora rasikravindrae]|uniref:Ysc84 actin-binding domain-containing protein n=1 Tax=Apiospora rasikravindrae TaxID=990691 RepID=A0ABR1T0G5_9PEZI
MVRFLALAGMATSRSGGGHSTHGQYDGPDQKSHLQQEHQPRPPARHYSDDNSNHGSNKLTHSPPTDMPATTLSKRGKRNTFGKPDDDADDYSNKADDPTRPQYHLPQQTPGSPTASMRTEDRDYMMMQGHDAPPSYEDSMATHQRNAHDPANTAITIANGDDDDNNDTIGDGMRRFARVAALGAAAALALGARPTAAAAGTGTALYAVAASRIATNTVAHHGAAAAVTSADASGLDGVATKKCNRRSTLTFRCCGDRSCPGDQGPPPPSPRILAPSLTAPPMPIGRPKTSSGNSVQQWSQKLNSTAAMDKECVKARKILQSFLGGGAEDPKPTPNRNGKPTVQIPDAVLQQAHGLVIYTVIRAGLNLSGSRGSGVVLARLPSRDGADGSSSRSIASSVTSWGSFRRWSGPSAFSVYGAGATLIGGFDVSESVCVLNSEEAVRAFYASTTSRGAELGNYQRNSGSVGGLAVAAGPTTVNNGGGTGGDMLPELSGEDAAPPPMWIYTKTRGLYIGGSVDGTVFSEKRDVNESFYDEPGITPDRILTGDVRSEFKGAAGAVLGGISALGFGEMFA